MLIDLHKTIQRIRDKLPEDAPITFKMLDQAYEHTLRLRSQILSIMYDMIEFGSAKKSDAKALGTGLSQTENKSLIKLADYFDVSIDYLLERTDNPAWNRPGSAQT